MASSIQHLSKRTAVVATSLVTFFFGAVQYAQAADGRPCVNGQQVKNLMALTVRPCPVQATAPRELTRRELKKLIATAESEQDHLKIARYYRTQAERLDTEAGIYEEAAAAFRHGPMIKNLMAASTPARYEFLAKSFREEAKTDRGFAASHETMAKNALARL